MLIQRILIIAAACVLLVGCGGLPKGTKLLQAEVKRTISQGSASLSERIKVTDKLLDDFATTFEPVANRWNQHLADATEDLAKAAKLMKDSDELIAKNSSKDKVAVETMALQAKEHYARAQALVQPIDRQVSAVQRLRANLGQELTAARAHHRKITAIDRETLAGTIAKAGGHWPKKKGTLEQRLKNIDERMAAVETSMTALAGAMEEEPAAIDWFALGKSLDQIEQESNELPAYAKATLDLCRQLYVSWEEILKDMEIQEGYEVTFHHKIRRITTVHAPGDEPGAGEEPKVNEKETWKAVPESTYKKHERHLGMALRYKDAGAFDSEAKAKAQPPGYNYVARRGYRNHYGYWRNDSWYWHRNYSYMGGMYWGNSYRPIGYREYDDYSRHRSSGRSWFGGETGGISRFGSEGSATRTNYSDSKFTKSGGFKQTRYKQTGGSFKGTKYSSSRTNSPSSSSSSSRSSFSSSSYRSSSSSGSRSFGGK